jgi:hypothetical protein
MAATLLTLLRRAADPAYRLGSTGLAMIVILLLYTFGENLEILVYLFWPGMVILGLALQESPHSDAARSSSSVTSAPGQVPAG